MPQFSSAREAKEFLVHEIVDEAQRENVPLSEITESGWTLPDIMEVAEEFDRDYDQGEYERKIARLIARAAKRAVKAGEYDTWKNAIRALDREDHYLSLMIRYAHIRPPHDRLKLWGTAFALVVGFMSIALFATFVSDRSHTDFGKYVPTGSHLQLYFWAAMVALFVLHLLANAVFGDRHRKLMSNLLDRLLRGRTGAVR
ncbi:MAG: hypothetical protein WBQ34_13535 [Candidatus Acidiferrales bacterium]